MQEARSFNLKSSDGTVTELDFARACKSDLINTMFEDHDWETDPSPTFTLELSDNQYNIIVEYLKHDSGLETMTLSDLKDLASKNKIDVFDGITREELVHLVNEYIEDDAFKNEYIKTLDDDTLLDLATDDVMKYQIMGLATNYVAPEIVVRLQKLKESVPRPDPLKTDKETVMKYNTDVCEKMRIWLREEPPTPEFVEKRLGMFEFDNRKFSDSIFAEIRKRDKIPYYEPGPQCKAISHQDDDGDDIRCIRDAVKDPEDDSKYLLYCACHNK